jgi:hypothetical protein
MTKKLTVALVALVAVLYTGCATQAGNDRLARHQQDQIELVRVQAETRERMALDRAQAQAQWALAMAQVAQSAPDSADAIAVALAVSAVKGNEEGSSSPVVTLQRQENGAREWARILASPVLGSLTQLGIAGINGEVQKNASDNMAKVQMNEDVVDQAQFEVLGNVATAVSSFGATAIQNAGGNTTTTYSVADTGILDMSQTTSGDTTSGDTNSDSYNTSGDTNSDSYNTQGDTNADSYNTQGDTTTDSSTTDSSDNSDNSTGGP